MSEITIESIREKNNFRDTDDSTIYSCHNCMSFKKCAFKGHRGCICNLWRPDKYLKEELMVIINK